MLKRIYVDNFRCLVNFELKLDRLNLLLGENGTGKTTVFEVLYRLQQFLAGNAKVQTMFPSADLTRWQSTPTQRFELELQAGEANYDYALVIEHDEDRRKARIKSEILTMDDKRLFDFLDGNAELYYDDFTPGPKYPFDWTQSGLAVLQPRADNKKLTRFRKELQQIIVAAVHPMCMSSESRAEESTLSRNMENFVSWYRYVSQEHQGATYGLVQELARVLPGFSSFSLKEAGEAKVFKVMMKRPSMKQEIPFDFSELSDGQRCLIALYAVLFVLKDQGVSLFLDEPDNFITLREIQPWLGSLKDLIGEGVEQGVLISHHPEIIDQLAIPAGRWFERDPNAYSRVSDQPGAKVEGLKPSEAMARGWTK
jgi:predicted ATPase